MSKSAHPHEQQRLLADGRPAGPEQDALWARIDATLDAEAAAAVPSLLDRLRALPGWMRGLSVALPAAAAVLLFVYSPETDPSGITGRGDPSEVSVIATCGTPEHPCRVGERVFFEAIAGTEPVAVELLLIDDGQERLLADLALEAGGRRKLTQAIVPEVSDSEHGIELLIRVGSKVQRLHLEVRP